MTANEARIAQLARSLLWKLDRAREADHAASDAIGRLPSPERARQRVRIRRIAARALARVQGSAR